MEKMEKMEKTIQRELRFICREIGTRVFGSEEERRLAGHVERRFSESGLETRVEEFPVTVRDFSAAAFGTLHKGRKRAVPFLVSGMSGFTGREEILELVYLENIGPEVLRRHNLQGKAVLLYGGLGESFEGYRRFLESGVRALIQISSRHPMPWPVTGGMACNWQEAGVLPMVSIPYFEAEKILLRQAGEIYLDIRGRKRPAESQNVVGLKRGRGRKNIVVCAHHDSVGVGLGAIDNGTGVAVLLALAEKLAGEPAGAKNIALVSFGAEEMLSRGSFDFVARNPGFVADTVMVFNLDGEGSRLGQSKISYAGDARLGRYLSIKTEKSPRYYLLQQKLSPYSDQFPFNLAGVPSAWFMRHNIQDHYYQFHSRKDLPGAVDTGIVAASAGLILEMALELADGPGMPFPRAIPSAQAREIARLAGELKL